MTASRNLRQNPGNQLPDSELPTVLLVWPDLKVTVLKPDVRIPLHADETNPDSLLINLDEAQATAAVSGTYSVVW